MYIRIVYRYYVECMIMKDLRLTMTAWITACSGPKLLLVKVMRAAAMCVSPVMQMHMSE